MKSQNTAPPDYSNQLLRRLYATLADEAHWPDVMEEICFGFQACGTALVKHDFASGQAKIIFHCSHFGEAMQRHRDLFSRDPCFTSGAYFKTGSVMLGSELARLAGLVGEKISHDHFQELGIHHRLYGVLERSGMSVQFLFLGRPRSKPPFNAAEKGGFLRFSDFWGRFATWGKAVMRSYSSAMPLSSCSITFLLPACS